MNFSLNAFLKKYDRHFQVAGVVIASLAAGFYSASQEQHQIASVEMEKKLAMITMCESTENRDLDICVKLHESARQAVATIQWDWQDGREHDAR